MTTHLLKPNQSVEDLRLRCGLSATKAKKNHYVGTEDNIGSIDCAGCLRDLVVELRSKSLGEIGETPEGQWLAGGDTGVSSITIWSVMTGRPRPKPDWRPDIPHDPADFGRCHRLLELFPAWRERMHEVAAAHPAWAGLVAAWAELTSLYLEELPSGRGPRTWARMKEVSHA